MILWTDNEEKRLILTEESTDVKISLSLEEAIKLQEQLDLAIMKLSSLTRQRHLNGIF